MLSNRSSNNVKNFHVSYNNFLDGSIICWNAYFILFLYVHMFYRPLQRLHWWKESWNVRYGCFCCCFFFFLFFFFFFVFVFQLTLLHFIPIEFAIRICQAICRHIFFLLYWNLFFFNSFNSFYTFVNPSIIHTVSQSIDQSISETNNQTNKQTINQSINQSIIKFKYLINIGKTMSSDC